MIKVFYHASISDWQTKTSLLGRIAYKLKLCIDMFRSDSFMLMRLKEVDIPSGKDYKVTIDRWAMSNEQSAKIMHVIGSELLEMHKVKPPQIAISQKIHPN